MLSNKSLGFFGAGAMTEAILSGLLQNQKIRNEKVSIVNRSNQQRMSQLAKQYEIQPDQNKIEHVLSADIIILAVKPTDLFELLKDYAPTFQKGQLVISVAAGIRVESIEAFLNDEVAVVRSMPNTSSSIGKSATAITAGK